MVCGTVAPHVPRFFWSIFFVFGTQNFLNDMGSFRAPSLIPLATYTASVPIAGALIVLFAVEQIVNGWRHGFEGPEDADDFAGIVK